MCSRAWRDKNDASSGVEVKEDPGASDSSRCLCGSTPKTRRTGKCVFKSGFAGDSLEWCFLVRSANYGMNHGMNFHGRDDQIKVYKSCYTYIRHHCHLVYGLFVCMFITSGAGSQNLVFVGHVCNH